MLVFLEWSAAFITWFLVRVQPYWRKIEPFLRLIILIIVTLIVTFWVAVFCYLLLYYVYVPVAKINKPLNLKFLSSCKESGEFTGVACSFPKDNVSLFLDGKAILSFGQSYKLFFTIEVPESIINRQIGMFMVGFKMFSVSGKMMEEAQRPVMLEYKSPFLESIETFIFAPMFLLGSRRQKQILQIEMFSDLIDNPYNNIQYCEVTVYTQLLQYYSGSLQLYANFVGIRSFMFYYPISSAFCFVTVFFLSLNFLVLINWLHRQWVKMDLSSNTNNTDTEDNEEQKEDSVNGSEEDEDFWPEPRPCIIAGQAIVHRNYKPKPPAEIEMVGPQNDARQN